jgi:general secretion pathway protein J
MPHKFHSSSRAGFTLVELTLAITLLGVLAAILYGSFYLGHRAMEKAHARTEQSQRLRAGRELLSGYIRSAYPYRLQSGVFFAGDEDRLSFVSSLSVGLGGRGVSLVRVSWSGEGEGSGDLVLEEEMPVRLNTDGEDAGYTNRIVLRRGVRGFRIGYLEQDSRGSQESWTEQWAGEERNGLPRAVRLSYREDTGEEEVQWIFPIMMSILAP